MKYITLFIILIIYIPIRAYSQSAFDYYHPPHSTGKWEKRSNDTLKIDTIVCYVVEPFKIVSAVNATIDTVDIVEVSQKAMRAWNILFEAVKIPLRINVLPLPANQAQSNDVILDQTTTRNLIGAINNNGQLPTLSQISQGNLDTAYGYTRNRVFQTTINTQNFTKSTRSHIGMNRDLIQRGYLVRGQGNRSQGRKNIYLTMCHEMGHLLGIANNHCVPPESIMRSGSALRSMTLENYTGVGEIPLDEIDKKLLKTVYHQFFLPSQHSNPTCIPISNLPVPNSGYIILPP